MKDKCTDYNVKIGDSYVSISNILYVYEWLRVFIGYALKINFVLRVRVKNVLFLIFIQIEFCMNSDYYIKSILKNILIKFNVDYMLIKIIVEENCFCLSSVNLIVSNFNKFERFLQYRMLSLFIFVFILFPQKKSWNQCQSWLSKSIALTFRNWNII